MISFLLHNIPNILNLIFIPLASFYLFRTFSEIKSRRALFFSIGTFAILYSAVVLLVEIMPIRFVLTYGCVLILSLGFLMKVSYRLLLSGVMLALLADADVLSLVIHMMLFDISLEQTYIEPYYSLGVIQIFAIVFAVLFIIAHTKHGRFANVRSKKTWILYSLPLATVLVNWAEYGVVCKFDLSADLELLLIATSFVLILTNFIVFYISDHIYDQLQNEYKLRVAEEMIVEQSKKYFSLVENSAEIRMIKHDQRNFILGAITDLQKEKYEDLEMHLKEQLDTLQKVSYSSSDIPVFDTIVEYKQTEAQKYGIGIVCDRSVHGTVCFDSIDLAVILGNLLDNAIEATSKIKDAAAKSIEVFVEVRNDYILLSIVNPVEKEVNVRQLKTTKREEKDHGIGLLSVQKIVDRYSGTLLLSCQGGKFEASVMLPRQEPTNRDAQNAKRV